MLLALNTFPFLEAGFAMTFVLIVAASFYFLGRREAAQQIQAPAAPVTPAMADSPYQLPYSEGPAPAPATGGFKFRKIAPALVFVGAIILFILLRPALHSLFSAGAPLVAPDAMNASSEQVVADQIAGGYVQAGSLISRIVISILFYALFSFIPWNFQKVTHPAFAAWKKEKYKVEFDLLTAAEKFDYDKGMSQSVALRVVATAIFCLVS